MPKLTRYGKKNVIALKTAFFEQNDVLKEDLLRINAIYAAQPARERCKICDARLPSDGGFAKHGVAYVVCTVCRHLNGRHEDTDTFCAAVYNGDGGSAYAKNYTSADTEAYRRRVQEIYVPKAQFLADALTQQGFAMESGCVDLGAGSGYFVSALQECGIEKVAGYEVSQSQIELARRMNSKARMIKHELDEICTLAANVDADVISMIGVLEHLRQPRSLLQAIGCNRNVRYIYLSVPLFSSCVVLEAVFPEVMPRQLAGGHTHLFTEASLDHMAQEFGLERVAEWWFGSDMVDLFRSLSVQLGKTPGAQPLQQFASDSLLPLIDELQLVVDRKHLSSEVHMVFKVFH
jgi:hypothetical protein